MNRIAYIDHSYHQKTKSTEFMPAFLAAIGKVDLYWDDSWATGEAVDWTSLNQTNYNLIVFFQILPSDRVLGALHCRAILLIPMYDSVGDAPLRNWVIYRNYAFLSFSEKVHRDLSRLGINSFRLQYFPDPEQFPPVKNPDASRVFFWERSQDVTVSAVQYWFRSYPELGFHHHESLDPGKPRGSPEPIPSGWGSSQWFETREAYQSVVDQCNIYVAPRRREGIGMSFLEAMARGMAVVGWNYPTYSEYVIDGKNGVLLSGDASVPAHLDWVAIGKEARRSVQLGYQIYCERLPMLRNWLSDLIQNPRHGKLTIPLFLAWVSRLVQATGRWGKALLIRWIRRPKDA